MPNPDEFGNPKIFRGDGKLSQWAGATEWYVPNKQGQRHPEMRILRKPNGQMGYSLKHYRDGVKLLLSPWYPDGGKATKPIRLP
ncbi:hypothetical protein [Phocoenobacter skyensis]|uniref:Uncharacterized protein n=1 Tax=Phocoenobacter skyensis TaxID=97481 RepID=A0A1H7TUK2_9PAST|nr:hypothetical protein [Pasteurella skyensis]MDP8078621.1 hypothetical protein [Pasteurella skyensis]MDP8084615.1 hypothetical protein [Pasteurella skyensis]MDP8184239.1 hypothetical protein [Pasteurella skyensis]QLB22889.1 hypothetical protein A6B44_06585 [Pasteurella skyensis]SEL88550.1 hypothetical protein SAMN05444853_10128 [Pasteurella skyensis]